MRFISSLTLWWLQCLPKPSKWPAFIIILLTGLFILSYSTYNLWRERISQQVRATVNLNTKVISGNTSAVKSSESILWQDPGPFHVAYPGNYTFTMDHTEACQNTIPFLILMVPMRPDDIVARDVIRKTWGNKTRIHGRLVRTLFLVGLPGGEDAARQQELLRMESRLRHDLVQSSFRDSYRNLTIKTMVMLEWLARRCPAASYVMKVDSDMFLNVPNLVKLLLDPTTPRQNYMTGLVWWHSPVLRNPSNKFFMPREVIGESEYPPYPLGMAYVMSLDLPKKILSVAPQIKPIFIEDAYLGMCLKRLNIAPTDPPDKSMFRVNPWIALSRCSLSKVIAVTTTGTQQLMTYWEENNKPEPPC